MVQDPGYSGVCGRCGNKFTGLPFPPTKGKPVWCPTCSGLLVRIREIQDKLMEEEELLDRKDSEIAKKYHTALSQEGISNEANDYVESMINMLTDDAKRRKKIIEEIKSLQKKKK